VVPYVPWQQRLAHVGTTSMQSDQILMPSLGQAAFWTWCKNLQQPWCFDHLLNPFKCNCDTHTQNILYYSFYGKGVPKKRDTYFQDGIDDVFPLGACPCTVAYAMHRLHISWHHCPYFGIFGYYIFNSYWNPHLEHSVLGVHVQFWDLTQSSPSKTRSQTATEGQQP
jgi:hypothetical protein